MSTTHRLLQRTATLRFAAMMLATVAALVVAAVAAAPAATADTVAQYHVTTDVSGRHSPTAAPSPDYGVPAGGLIDVQCQVNGEPVGPLGNTLYFLAVYNGQSFYIPDTWTDSPHHAGEPPLAGIPMCDSGSDPATNGSDSGTPATPTSTWTPDCNGNAYASQVEVQNYSLGQFEVKVTPTDAARFAGYHNDIDNATNQIWHAVQNCVSGLYGTLADGIYEQIHCHEIGSYSGWLHAGGDTYDFESWRTPVGMDVAVATECNWGGWPYVAVGSPYRPDQPGNQPTY